MVDREQFVQIIRKEQGSLTDAEFAGRIGVSPQFICDIYKGRRDPGKKIATFFGYEPIVAYKLSLQNKRRSR